MGKDFGNRTTGIKIMKTLTHGSLFNGIGGFQLAAEWAGWENVFSCEIDDFCNKITKYHYPKCKQYYDIKKTCFKKYRGQIDVLSGGFPCQVFSVAGKRLGTADDRYLWPEMYRAVKEIQPRWVVAENVLGIVNWSAGLVFEQVYSDLEAQGYEVQSFILPAAGVGAPHQRYRTWFVAYNPNARIEGLQLQGNDRICGFENATNSEASELLNEDGREKRTITDAYSKRRELRHSGKTERTRSSDELLGCKHAVPNWDDFPTQSPVCGGDDGFPYELDGVAFPHWRRESIKAYGNAIVPQVALQIFKTINEYEKLNRNGNKN